ncbi:MAG: glycosyltransferase family 2 protein [Candidatus Methylarchaceae archaeon HK01B]|nr:glycosyltransferase family 2 protein [Candidatus Methylarchaceae archaeon HK01B]
MAIAQLILLTLTILQFLLSLFIIYSIETFPSLPINPMRMEKEPSISIIIPVRNEEDTLKDCLDSITNLDYAKKEIIVVDGNSTDGTGNILESFQEKIEVLEEENLPEGWVGKNWACFVGHKRSKGEFLLFTDGDTIHSKDSLTLTVNYLLKNQVDMLSLYPKFIMNTFWEKLMIPTMAFIIFLFSLRPDVNDDDSLSWLGNGQYILIRRSVYENVGGHKAVWDRIDEDYRLAEKVKKSKFRLRLLYAPYTLQTRMYRNFRELWEGLAKNAFTSFLAVFQRKKEFLLAILASFIFLLHPLIVFLLGIVTLPIQGLNEYLVWGTAMISILYAQMFIVFPAFGADIKYVPLFPISVVIYIIIMAISVCRTVRKRGIIWKGRVYR